MKSLGGNVIAKTFSNSAAVSFNGSAARKPPQAPPLFTATPDSVREATENLISRSKKLLDNVVASVPKKDATFDKVLLPLAQDDNRVALQSHIIGFYQYISPDEGLRNASTDAEKMFDDWGIEASMREDIFQLVDAVFQRDETLDPESRRLLEKDRTGYIRAGLGVPAGPKRDRFKEIKKRLSELTIAFSKTLNEETGGLWFARGELDGMPDDVLGNLQEGTGENEGKVRLTFQYPDLFPALKYVKSAESRKAIYIANENKCVSNAPLFREAVILRDEAARILGYKNHADYRLENKMAKNAKTVDDFLGDLRERLAPGGERELDNLKRLKLQDLADKDMDASAQNDATPYYLWDHRFYDRLMVEKDYSVDQNLIAEYFPLGPTIEGMLHIFEELFGLSFVEIEGDERDALSETGKGSDLVWHEDVRVYSVWNDEGEGGGFVGYLYLDLHPRKNKYGHAANFNLQPGFIDEKGNRRYPATALVCNFSKPTPKKPSLLKHNEVTTLFHELGHGIHDLVSKTRYSRFHGTNTVQDFVEAPSQMLEEWCWSPSQIRSLSRHYSYISNDYQTAYEETAASADPANKSQQAETSHKQPPERMPDDLIEKLIRTKHVNGALANLRQLHFGIFDMTVHEPETHEDITALDIAKTYNRLRKDISHMDGPEALGQGYGWGEGYSTIGHFMGGYDAGYYGYLSSEVYSTDMFYSVFKKDPMNPEEGRRYRKTVLEPGGSQDEMQILVNFLGRKPSTEAFYKELGISK